MRLAGIFAAFAEEPIEGVEKCCQRFPGENTSGRSDEGSGLSAINAIPREYHAGCVE